MDALDQEQETRAQAAIDRFFKQNQIIPSPWDVRQQRDKSCISSDTPSRPMCDLNSTKELFKFKKDGTLQQTKSSSIYRNKFHLCCTLCHQYGVRQYCLYL